MAYPMNPDLVVGVAADEYSALMRIASELLDQDASEWLESLPAYSSGRQSRRCRFGDLYDHLTGFILEFDIEDEMRAGCVSEEDAALYAGVLSHCLQYHVKTGDILNGTAKRLVLEMGESGM